MYQKKDSIRDLLNWGADEVDDDDRNVDEMLGFLGLFLEVDAQGDEPGDNQILRERIEKSTKQASMKEWIGVRPKECREQGKSRKVEKGGGKKEVQRTILGWIVSNSKSNSNSNTNPSFKVSGEGV